MTDPRLTRLAARTRALRKDAGLTLDQVATATGISLQYLSQIERGLRLPALDVLVRLADALGVTVGELLDT